MESPPNGPVAAVRGLQLRYPGGAHALRGVDLELAGGELVAVVGASGSGKTTLLRCLNRMVEPTAGVVEVFGEPVAGVEAAALRRRIGYAQQDGGLLPHWTVRRNVGLVPRLLGWGEAERRAREDEVLELVGLPAAEFAHRHPRQLSGGQRQRVAFARALASRPQLLLLDEPFGALDPLLRHELRGEFDRLRRELGVACLLVTHDLGEALALGDRVAVLHQGQLDQVAPPAELRARPATNRVRALLELATGERA